MQHELGRGEESLQDTHCRAFLHFFFPIQMFCLQQHVFKLTKPGIFSELLPPSHRLPCRDIAAHMFHDLTLPGATWATPTNSRLCLETAQRVGDKSAPNCKSFLSIAEGALDTFPLFFPCFPPQNTIPGLKSRPGFSNPRFSNENSARTLLCSITEQIKHPLNCWTLKHHPQPLPVKDQDQIFNPDLSQNSKKSPHRVQLRSADSTAQFQGPDSFNSGSKHLYRAMEIRARCQWLPPSQKEHSDHQR